MTRNAYVDESQRDTGYVMAAVSVDHGSVADVRRELALLAPKGAMRRHFVRESDQAKRRMLAAFGELPGVEVVAIRTGAIGTVIEQRSRTLRSLVALVQAGGLDRIVLDHVEPLQRSRDRRDISQVLRGSRTLYGHEPSHSTEPLLWIPDAIAWCIGRRDWRARIDPWVKVHEVV